MIFSSWVWRAGGKRLYRVAGVSVVTACAVAGLGQGGRYLAAERGGEGGRNAAAPTVSVASLRIPREAWGHLDRAKRAAERNRPEEFERETAKALEIAPEFAEAHLLRAKVLVRTGRFAEVPSEVEAARRSDPGVMWAGVVLAGAYNGMHRFNDALLVLNAQRGAESESWQAMYERSRAETGRGDVEAALRWSAKTLESAPEEFADARLVRANALLLARRWREARDQMEVYLGSREPQVHRAEVLAMRATAAEREMEAGRQ